MLTKSQVRVLKYVYRHKRHGVPFAKLNKKYHDETSWLLSNHYLSCRVSFSRSTPYLCPIYKDAELVTLTDTGMCELEGRRWFNIQYLITQIIIPILVGIVSSVITAILLRMI